MKSLSERFATPEPACCMVCRRRAVPYGVPSKRNVVPIYWLCDDPVCIKVGRKVRDMPAKKLDFYEKKALRLAGEEAGQYLDQLGKTDLSKLDEPEWHQFCEKMLTGYERNMREIIESGEAPF
ncbi:MAG: hypothetical protein KIT65_10885 [Xanthobacteraceae bacterium]|nr:hypothetical protein [Xanthobacteraceae bacterium]